MKQFIKDTCSTGLILDEKLSVDRAKANPRVLKTLVGPMADWSRPTRNKRMYSKELWERVLASESLKEMLDTKTFFGECDHPLDKDERIDLKLTEVSHQINRLWFDEANRCLMGEIDILDTPAGRIVNTFVEYGSKLGVSSRGSGSWLEEASGVMNINEDDYFFVTFDIVALPANMIARVKTNESLITSGDTNVNSTSVNEGYINSQFESRVGKLKEQLDMILTSGSLEMKVTARNLVESLEDTQLVNYRDKLDSSINEAQANVIPKITYDLVKADLLEACSKIATLKQINENLQLSLNNISKVETAIPENLGNSDLSIDFGHETPTTDPALQGLGSNEFTSFTYESEESNLDKSELSQETGNTCLSCQRATSEIAELELKVANLESELDSIIQYQDMIDTESAVDKVDVVTSNVAEDNLDIAEMTELADRLVTYEDAIQELYDLTATSSIEELIQTLRAAKQESTSNVNKVRESVLRNKQLRTELAQTKEIVEKLTTNLEEKERLVEQLNSTATKSKSLVESLSKEKQNLNTTLESKTKLNEAKLKETLDQANSKLARANTITKSLVESYAKLKCDELAVNYDLIKSNIAGVQDVVAINNLIRAQYNMNRRETLHIAKESIKAPREALGISTVKVDADYQTAFSLVEALR